MCSNLNVVVSLIQQQILLPPQCCGGIRSQDFTTSLIRTLPRPETWKQEKLCVFCLKTLIKVEFSFLAVTPKKVGLRLCTAFFGVGSNTRKGRRHNTEMDCHPSPAPLVRYQERYFVQY